MKISKLIFFSISFILLLFSITTVVNYNQSEEVRDNAEFLSISSNIVRQSNQFQKNVLFLERALKGYLFTGEEYLIQTYDSTSLENNTLLNELSVLLTNEPRQLEKLKNIQQLYNNWVIEFASPLIKTSKEQGPQKSYTSAELQSILQEEEKINSVLLQEFKTLLNYEYQNRAQRRLLLEESEQRTKRISIFLTALSIIVGFIIAFFLARHISQRILKMVRMANSIANGNYKVYVKDKSNDELSQLTSSLNHMASMLEQNISLLERKNKELDQFAYIVSHDLKAPLRGVDNLITWIIEDYSTDIPVKVNEYLELIKVRISRLEAMIQAILNYSKVGREVSEPKELDLNELLREIVEDLPVKKGITLTIQERMPVIISERLPLAQIFTNLVSNAIKHHDKEVGSVNVFMQEEPTYFKFFVQDNGPGIAKGYHERIFTIFQTLQARDTFESTGVGLAIVKKILDERGEQIKIESEVGQGTTFIFTWAKDR